jgi:xanthine dehydrogenase iron-sulfur cluster and FAD-binding subunit A
MRITKSAILKELKLDNTWNRIHNCFGFKVATVLWQSDNAWDLAAPEGTPVYSITTGKVVKVKQSTPSKDGKNIVLSLTRMKRIRMIDEINNTITVDAGVTLKTVQETADSLGKLFPLSLASEGSCTIGGNLATNAGGVQVEVDGRNAGVLGKSGQVIKRLALDPAYFLSRADTSR